MEKSTDKKTTVGLGFIGRGLGELLELKASCRRRLEYLKQNRGRLSEYVYNKLTQEYRAYLDAVDGEVELGLSEYEIKLAEIRLFANQLKLLEKSYSERLEELSLRYSLGEFDREHYQRLCAEHESKLKKFAGSLEKYQGQKQKLEAFLSQADWRREPDEATAQAVADKPAVDDKPSVLDDYTAADESLRAEEQRVVQPEPAVSERPAPPTSNGPPSSSLLELDSTLDRSLPEPELPVVEPQPAGQAAPVSDASAPEMTVEESPDLTEQSSVEAALEDILVPATDEGLDDLPSLTEASPADAVAEALSVPEPEAVAEEAAAESRSLPQEAVTEPLEEVTPELQVQSEESEPVEVQAAQEPPLMEELPESPVAREPAEKPFQLEVDLPEEPAQNGSTGTDLEALMGGGSDAISPQAGAESAVAEQDQASAKEDSGFDLESIFGSSPPAPEPEEQPTTELEMDTPVQAQAVESVPESSVQPEPEEPVGQEQVQPPAPVGSIEDELLHDLAADLDVPQAVESPSGEPEPAETGGGLDLDDLIDEAGAAAAPDHKPQSDEPPAEIPVQQAPEVEQVSEPEEQLADIAQAAPEPVDSPQPEERTALSEPEIPEPEPESVQVEPELTSGPGPGGGNGSLVSMALQRAAQESEGQDEPLDEVEVAVDLDDGVELIGGGGEAEVRLTMNQTIDAIKKKTVKCPSCGTMNYAIRWYCENCESTLTAL